MRSSANIVTVLGRSTVLFGNRIHATLYTIRVYSISAIATEFLEYHRINLIAIVVQNAPMPFVVRMKASKASQA